METERLNRRIGTDITDDSKQNKMGINSGPGDGHAGLHVFRAGHRQALHKSETAAGRNLHATW